MRSILNKLNEFRVMISKHEYDFIALTETWLNSDHTDQLVDLPGYKLLRMDRVSGKRGGGVLLYVRELWKPNVIKVEDNKTNEIIWGHFKLNRLTTIVVGCAYRTPNAKEHEDNALFDNIRRVCLSHSKSKIILLGDFNMPNIDWQRKIFPSVFKNFEKLINDCLLQQNVLHPTRGSNILDLMLTRYLTFSDVQVNHLPPIGNSDHDCLSVRVDISLPYYSSNVKISKPDNLKYCFNNVDWNIFNNFLSSVDWNPIANSSNVNNCWNLIKENILLAIQKTVPQKKVRNIQKSVPWLKNCDLEFLNRKREAWKNIRNSVRKKQPTDPQALLNYKLARNETTNRLRNMRKDYERRLAENIGKNPKPFYKYANLNSTQLKSPSALLDEKQNKIENKTQILELFADYFSSVFLQSSPWPTITGQEPEIEDILQTINTETVIAKLAMLKLNKSPGPDKIPNVVLKFARNAIAPYLCHLFKISIQSKKLPDEWKYASVVPIHKSGDMLKRENYRPVSLTSTVCKVLEQLVLDRLWHYVAERCPISDNQFGFRSHRSCSSQLISYVDELSYSIDKRLCADVAYLDLSKAFDKVSHSKLIQKLLDRNIPITLVKWIKHFLKGRTQKVVIENHYSNPRKVTSGVPQGSILGPILFLLYSDDVDKTIEGSVKMYKFADDMKICHTFSPKCATKDAHNLLQKCLTNLSIWCNDNCLPLNLTKCSIVHFGLTNPRFTYQIDQHVLASHSTERDLGVIFDERLNFQPHIDNIVNKARRLTGLMLHSFQSRSENVILPLYKTLIRPILEYASVAWNPYLIKQVKQIESVQRYITKRIIGYSLMSYDDRLSALKLPCLSNRREYFDLVEMYKVINGLTFVTSRRNFSFLKRGTRGHSSRIRQEKFKQNVRKSALFIRAVNRWNSLPSTVVEAKNVISFKTSLRKLLFSKQPIT